MENHSSLIPPLGITMGCPVSIGPEIILRLYQGQEAFPSPVVVIGDRGVLERTAQQLHVNCRITSWSPGDHLQPGTIPVYAASTLPVQDLIWGEPTLNTGRAMVAYIEQAVQLIQQHHLSGMVTCPISKIALQRTGSPYPGHTEMLAALTAAKRFRMMMAGHRLKVVLVTIHEQLSQVSGLLCQEEILDCVAMTMASLQRDFALSSPKVAVAGLNPHCGESGMFGTEEDECIAPAVSAYSGPGGLSGPWPPDTVFFRAANGDFDAVIAMYHDQGLIPFKLLHFHDGVNVTLGLPIVRTSVDHGTAYDIAGQGIAGCTSLQAAVDMAAAIVVNRTRGTGI